MSAAVMSTSEGAKWKQRDNMEDFDEEDCKYVLHALEMEAFASVVTAMRAQGMLTEYKEVLLDHLKTALFISDATYKAEVRRAANDDVLCKIAATLNPSYDTYAQWGVVGTDPIPPAFNEIPLYDDHDMDGLDVADQLLRLANSHNAGIEQLNVSLGELIGLPKAPYVPERLRALLRETENDAEDRIKLNLTSESPQRAANVKKLPANSGGAKRGRKARVLDVKPDVKEESSTENEILERTLSATDELTAVNGGNVADGQNSSAKSDILRPSLPAISDGKVVNTQICEGQAATAVQGILLRPSVPDTASPSSALPAPPAYAPLAASPQRINSAIVRTAQKFEKKNNSCADDHNEQLPVEDDKPKRRRSRPGDNATCVCARVLPFIFEPAVPGQKMKPPRGNPDRRTAKRPSTTTAPVFASTGPSGSAQSANSGTLPQPYTPAIMSRNVPLSPSTPAPVARVHVAPQHSFQSGLLIKRARTSSLSNEQQVASTENGVVYARTAAGCTSNVGKGQQPLPRAYMRSSTGTKFYVSSSQAASAYSNPTRPYYGNPSAAAMGITVRSGAGGSAPGSIACSSSPAGSSSERHSLQNGQSGDVQHISGLDCSAQGTSVLLPTMPQQYKGVRRSSFSAKSGYSISSQMGTRASSASNGMFPQQTQAVQLNHAFGSMSSVSPVSSQRGMSPHFNAPPLSGSHPHVQSSSKMTTRTAGGNFSVSPVPSSVGCIQHASIHQSPNNIQQPQSSAEALAAANSILQDSQQVTEDDEINSGGMIERMNEDGSVVSIPSNDCLSQEVRLECDEVMDPEQQRCIIPSTSVPTASIMHLTHSLRKSGAPQQVSLVVDYGGESSCARVNPVTQSHLINGVLHENVEQGAMIGLIPAHSIR